MVAIDYFSKWLEVLPTPSRRRIAEDLLKNAIVGHGASIHSRIYQHRAMKEVVLLSM